MKRFTKITTDTKIGSGDYSGGTWIHDNFKTNYVTYTIKLFAFVVLVSGERAI